MVDFVKSLRDGVCILKDGTGTPLSTTLVADEGDIKIKESREYLEILDRGVLHLLKSGNQVPVEWSMSVKMAGYEVGSAVTMSEAMLRRGAAVAWVSTMDADTDVYTFGMEWQLKGKDGSTEETVALNHCYCTSFEAQEGDPNMMVASGRAFVTAPAIS